MPPRRRKKHLALKILSDEILPSRRSSLQVNLSYLSNLSDSGNGSFRSTQPDNELKIVDQSRTSLRQNVLSKISETLDSKVSNENPVVSAMQEREVALSESCELLKEAIMNKTREMFDGRAELSLKTATILKGTRQALREINDDSKNVGTRRKITATNVIHSPSSKVRSFGRISEVDNTRKTLKTLSSISRCNKSLILGGSDKSRDNPLSKINEKVLMVKLTRLTDPRLDISMESTISDIGAPITCSSFIAGHGNFDVSVSQRAEKNLTVIAENSKIEDTTQNVEVSSLTPMEITAIQAKIAPSSRKSFACLRRDKSFVSRTKEKSSENRSTAEVIPMELTSVQSHIQSRQSSSSNKTTRTSLNVNTSTSLLSRTPETRVSKDFAGTSRNYENNDLQNDRVDDISLKVNTSLEKEVKKNANNENHSLSDKNNTLSDKNETAKSLKNNAGKNGTIISDSDSDSIENISLIARLRNISNKKLHRSKHSDPGEGPSFVEGTPYPPSRSILWRTQIRSETIRARKNFANSLKKKLSKSSDSDSSMTSLEYATAPNSTIILGESPCRIKSNTKNPQIIEDSSLSSSSEKEDEESAKITSKNVTIPSENTMLDVKKTGKKKLLPLRDKCEVFSFSPLSPAVKSPKKPITWKPRKYFRKRKSVTRAVAEKRIENLLKENNDDDDDIACSNIDDIKTQNTMKKVKKPRKVISKKFVVKKMADNKKLLESLGGKNSEQSVSSERSSMDVFLKKKRFSVAERNVKPQKLVIVATGFSKGDVDLVKGIVKELGGAELNSMVTRRTTHVVSTGVRTINLLRGIIRGCWLISLEWVLKSLENNKWLNAEKYEMIHFSKAVQENRRDRQIFGKSYVPELFTACGTIHIEHGTSPPADILKELVKTAGGRIAENPRDARLSVGPNGLREIWILDSITTGDLQPIVEYQRKKKILTFAGNFDEKSEEREKRKTKETNVYSF